MSTLKVNKIENTGTTDGGIEIDSDGHVQLDGVQFPTVGPLSNRNLVINGAFNVHQRGGTQSTDGKYCMDRWKIQENGGAVTLSQQDLTTTGGPYDEGFRHFARLVNDTAASGTGNYRQFLTKIEASTIAQSGWNYTSASSYVTLSFWVRSSVAGNYGVTVQSDDGTKQEFFVKFNLSANTWTKVEQKIPGNSSLTIDNNNDSGLQILFRPWIGSNYTDSGRTGNTWNPAGYTTASILSDDIANWGGSTNAIFDVTGVQLEVGEKATPFEHRSYGDELARCQRYYYRWKSGQDYDVVCDASVWSGSGALGTLYFPVTMRVGPSLSVSAVDDFCFSATNADKTLTGFVRNRETEQSIQFFVDGASWSLSAGVGGFIRDHASHPSFIEFDAEL